MVLTQNYLNLHNLNKNFFKQNNLPEKYILFVGNIEKRKNLFGLIAAFEKINKAYKQYYT